MLTLWNEALNGWGTALAILLAGGLVGWLAMALLFRRLHALAARTETRTDDYLLESTRGLWLLFSLLVAALPANRLTPLEPELQQIVQRVVLATILVLVTVASSRFVGLWFSAAEQAPGQPAGRPSLVAKAARVAVLLAGSLLVLENAGVDISTLLTVAGVGSLAIGLALQPTLSNFFAGLHLSMSKPVRVGDFVELEDGTQGEVVDISWRTTEIRQMANNLAIVPNARFAEMRIFNYSRPVPAQSTLVAVGVAYGSDLEQVERVTLEVAKEVMLALPEGDKELEPAVRFHTFGDSAIQFNVVLRAANMPDRFILVHEFVKRLKQRYHAEGIEIPFPQRVVHRKAVDATADTGARSAADSI